MLWRLPNSRLAVKPRWAAIRVASSPAPSSSLRALPSSALATPAPSPRRTFVTSLSTRHAVPSAPVLASEASDQWTATHSIPAVSIQPGSTPSASPKVVVTWGSGSSSAYHSIWLRDHCRCPSCYHPKTKQRLLDTFNIPPHIAPARLEATAEGLVIEWPNEITSTLEAVAAASSSSASSSSLTEGGSDQGASGHTSIFPWSWLHRNSYAPRLDDASLLPGSAGEDASGRVLWGRGIANDPPTVPHDEVMADDRGVLKWVSKISRYGFCFVSGVPPTPEATEALIRRIAFIRETHYGGFWDFTSNLEHGDTAYTNLRLGAHTDTTYFTEPAGLQMFHLLSHEASENGVPPSGGESLLVDGFLAAKVLKEVHPEAYETLSRCRVLTHSAGDDDTLIRPLLKTGYPILQHDDVTGELVMVRYNNDDRSVLRLAEDEVEPFYDALRKWHEVLTNAEGEYWQQLTPGNALIFDNHRVLHGRSSFVGARRLCGAYVSGDDFRSRLDVLRSRYPEVERGRGSARISASREAEGDEGKGFGRGVWDDGL